MYKAFWSLIFDGFEKTGYKATQSPQMQLLWSIMQYYAVYCAKPTAVNVRKINLFFPHEDYCDILNKTIMLGLDK